MIIKFRPNAPKVETKLVCNDCSCDQVETKKAGDEGWDVCPNCRSVENSTEVEIPVGEYSICSGIVSNDNPAGFDIVQIGNNQQIRQYDSDENWIGTANLKKSLANYTLRELERLFQICTCKTCFDQIALVNGRTDATALSITMDWEKSFGMMPRHKASSSCESGKRNHCTCDTCF